MENLVGIHKLLASTPIWFTAFILYLFTDGALYLMRDKLEGLGYQTAYSAKFGDLGLLAAVWIGATILQRPDVYVPAWLHNGFLQIVILAVCIALGIATSIMTNGMRSGQAGDMYHDIVIAPAILFLAIMLVPVFWYNARWYEASFIVIAVITWASLIYIDLTYDRFVQRQWLIRHDFHIKGEIPR